MRYISRFLLPVSLLLLSSCFATRQKKSAPVIQIMDPVQLEVDTSYFTPSDGSDTTYRINTDDTLQSQNDPNTDTLKHDSLLHPADSLLAQESDSLLMEMRDSLQFAKDLADSDTLIILGTGDIMPGTDYPDNRYLPPGNDCHRLFDPVREVLQDADVTFGNLEGVFCPEGGTPKKCKDPSVCYVFRMPESYLDCILDAGYNVLSVANNHVNDFGVEGRIQTAKFLEEAGVPFAGFRSKPSAIFTIDGVRYGFAAFAPHLGTVNLKEYAAAAEIVSALDSVCDVVIVSAHGGAEGKDHQHVPCTDEIYLGYNRGNICTFAHTVIDAGADVVFGHGPHVIRAMELYNDRLICYSLGNFCTYARFNLRGPNGLAPIVKVYTDRKGKFLGGEVISVYQAGEGGPRLDPENKAVKKLQELSAADFPDSRLVIDDKGKLYEKSSD